MNTLKRRHIFSFLLIIIVFLLAILTYKIISPVPTISPAEIKSVKMIGGLHISSKVLLPGNDDENIAKLANMVNRGINLGKASEKDIGYIYSEARPIRVLFEKQNGDQLVIWVFYQPNSNSNGGIASREKVILSKIKNGVDHFYVIKSKELVDFIMYDSKKIMPF